MNWFEKNVELATGITLRGFKTFKGAGAFGNKGGFEATAMLDGKAIANFSDANDGGMLQLEATRTFEDIAKKHFIDEPYSSSAEKFVYFLVDHHVTVQKFKRLCKTKVLSIDNECSDSELLQVPAIYSVEYAKFFKEKHPGIYIINEHI